MFLALIRKPQYAGRQAPDLRSASLQVPRVPRKIFWKSADGFRRCICSRPTDTETSPCIAIADWDDPNEVKAVSAGHVIEHVKARIVDLATGKEAAPGKAGEIQVQGYNVMLGYYHLPQAMQGLHRGRMAEDRGYRLL